MPISHFIHCDRKNAEVGAFTITYYISMNAREKKAHTFACHSKEKHVHDLSFRHSNDPIWIVTDLHTPIQTICQANELKM